MVKKIVCVLLTACVAVTYTGCSVKTPSVGIQNTSSLQNNTAVDNTSGENQTAKLDADKMFSESDRDNEYTGGYQITLSDGKIESNCDTLLVSDSTVTIKSAGTYIIIGSLSDGQITVDAGDTDKVRLVLNGVEITNDSIEGLTIDINGGNISVISSDDGLNAAGGNDGSGFGGGMQAMEPSSDAYIKISGGSLNINARGDGVDSNGALYVSGGETYIDGPESSGNGALDYDGTAEITGGVFVASGELGMAQNFGSKSTQGAMLIGISGRGGDEIILSDSESNVILRYTPSKNYNSILISCKEIEAGKTYTLASGGSTQTIEMTDLLYQSGVNNSAAMNGGGRFNRKP